jgi:transcriptional regulator with XRE-family HTH domain
LNEPLRRAMLHARVREEDVAARLGVDPKTVRRWLNGRVPYPSSRVGLANLLGVDESDLWPDAGGPLTARVRPEELGEVYPHRWVMPRDVWTRFFESAEHEIGILAYSALFLAEDTSLLGVLVGQASRGVRVRIALGHPDSICVAQRGQEAGIGDAMVAKIRHALALYLPLTASEKVEVRLHQTVLYNSIYRADSQVLVNQYAYGISAAQSPVFCFRQSESGDVAATYIDILEKVWDSAKPI